MAPMVGRRAAYSHPAGDRRRPRVGRSGLDTKAHPAPGRPEIGPGPRRRVPRPQAGRLGQLAVEEYVDG